jgi:hypothetical protein
VDRDALLAAALGAAVLTGCTVPRRVPALPSPTPSPSPPDPDVALLRSWAAGERRAVTAYDTPVRTSPALNTLRANHLARAAALEALLAERGASPSPPAIAAPGLPAPVAMERALVAGYLRDLAAVTDPVIAVLGAELAAGARQHLALLPLVPAPKR